MRVEITGKNIDITSGIRDHITARFERLEKWQINLIHPHVVLSLEPDHKFKIEADISIPGSKLIATSQHEDMFAAINDVSQKLEKQLNKQVHKPQARRASHSEIPTDETEIA